MATTKTIGGSGTLFVGEDKTFRHEVVETEYDANGKPIEPSATSVPVNIAGWAIVFDIRLKDTSLDPAIISKVATITGVYNATRSLNTQRALVTLTDTEMNLFKQKSPPYRYSWKRTDDGVETVLARGDFAPEKATAP